jgi:hypothetical protein
LLSPQNLPVLLALGVTVLGLIQYFLGFSDEAELARWATVFLLVGGLLAALRVLPNGPKTLPFAALFSVLGAFDVIDSVIGQSAGSTTPGIVVVVLILGIVQMLVAVGALLLDHNVVKLPAPTPTASHGAYGQQFGQQGPQGQFGQQPPRYGQPQGQPNQPQGQPGQSEKPGQYTPPGNPGVGQQSTTYSQQQGQFFQQPSSSEGASQQQKPPSTPPGGFGQQS